MARKSRKNVNQKVDSTIVTASYTMTGIYVRLSIENSGKDDDGDSIENQTSICKEYVEEHPDLKLYDIYEDNGKKGTNFDRPEFNRLMDDIRAGKVKCVLVKDLSRFGRDYIEAGEYLEKIFPFLGVRFISITDGYDSLTAGDAEGALMIPLKNMINDVYAKDISRKIITSFRARQEKGEYLPAFPPYGYVKSKTKAYRYEVDEEVAPYVRMIFEWKAAGVSHSEICKRLNDMGAVTPARRKVELGIWHAEKYKHTIWHGRTIIDIMKNATYTGTLVYGRMPKSLYQGIKCHRAKPDEWRCIPDAHEAIVSQELFDKVQKIFDERSERMQKKWAESKQVRDKIVNLFVKRIYCGDCGKRMRFVKGNNALRDKNFYYTNYVCGGYLDSGYRNCTRHSIRYQDVVDAVFAAMQVQMEYALNQEKMMQKLRGTAKERNLIDQYVAKVNYLTQELKKVNSRREGLFESFAEGILDEADYQYAKKSYDEEYASLEKQLSEAKSRKKELDGVLTANNEWLQAMHKVEDATELDQDLVNALVKKVLIYEDNRVEVEFKFRDQKDVLDRIFREMKKGAVQNG
ncbi:MAG: recombinase family protein [Oribacterium sp.]|jgi:DNA invertase Pin-like site-specific DNA recombinase|nr:recombinase family protein [Oribacterium sp.]